MRVRGRVVLLGLLLSACATWVPAAGVSDVGGMSAQLPDGWMRLTTTPGNEIVATRDGVSLEYIHISRTELDEEIPYTERTLDADMLPEEVAEVWLGSARLDPSVSNLQVFENAPARIDGRDCYRLHYSHRIPSGLQLRTLEYGCLDGAHHYQIRYRAAAQHYFDANLGAFENVTSSLRFD